MSKVLWAVGDGATGTVEARTIAQMVHENGTDLFCYLGDVYEGGTYEECVRNYGSVYGMLSEKTVPIPGNHDWPIHEVGYDPYFKSLVGEERASHYQALSLDSGSPWQLIFLNSEEPFSPGSAQYERLVEWLDQAQYETRRICFFHRPRYCSGSHGDASDLDPILEALMGKCKIVVSGHAHNMQRFKPDSRGIVQFVSGAGGRAHYATVPDDPRLDFGNPDRWGGLRIELSGNVASHKFVGIDGTVLDEGEISV